jgi:hypothetical protein
MPGWYAVIESHRLTAAGSPASSKPPDFLTLTETVETLENAGLAPVGLIASSDHDWGRYESLQWLTLENWLRENPDDHPEADEFRERAATTASGISGGSAGSSLGRSSSGASPDRPASAGSAAELQTVLLHAFVPEPEAALGTAHGPGRAQDELAAQHAFEAHPAHERDELLVERAVERPDALHQTLLNTPTTRPSTRT